MNEKVPHLTLFRILWQAVRSQGRNRLRQMLEQSRLMFSVICIFLMGYWVFFTWTFYRAIRFVLYDVPGLGDLLVARMFYVLFALIFVMLLTSSVIVGYGVFFRNRETAWLQTLPVSHGRLFSWKFLEASILASWAFLFLSGPLLIAYALALRMPVIFLVLVVAMYIPFSLLANALGTVLLLWLVALWHKTWGRRLVCFMAAVGLILAYLNFKPVDVNAMREAEIVPLMNMMLKNTRVMTSPVLPSYWLASSVLGLGDRLWARPVFFMALTCSYALLAGWLVLRLGGQLFYDNTSRVQDRRLHGRAHATRSFTSPLVWTGRVLVFGMRWLGHPARSILIKDWVIFWRDTAQWSQFAIFFGLLGFYFLNIHNLRFQLEEKFWVSIVAFLNMTSLGLILSTLTTRFIFPQFSLEGRRLWLVGLAPMSLRELIWSKFWASALMSGGITVGLMLFSFSSLNLLPSLRWVIGFTVILMSLGLSGIAVGLGVLFPNMKQTNSAQIVSGFGGTFCLVLSLGYVATTVMVVAVPMHMRYMEGLPLDFQFASPVGLIYTVAFLISAAAAIIPMRLAGKRLDQLEF